MVQAADRRQFGATSTPPSLPAPGWRRDPFEIPILRVLARAFRAGAPGVVRRHPAGCPAVVMVLAPVLGLAIWAGFLALLI